MITNIWNHELYDFYNNEDYWALDPPMINIGGDDDD